MPHYRASWRKPHPLGFYLGLTSYRDSPSCHYTSVFYLPASLSYNIRKPSVSCVWDPSPRPNCLPALCFPKMEEPQLAFSTNTSTAVKTSSLILRLFILAFFAFFLRHRAELARLSSARGSHPPTKVKRTKGATGRRYHPKKKKNKKNQKKRMARMDSLLDSSVEDIPVPILQPRSANTGSARNESESSGMLLDCFLGHLPFPVLEPIRVRSLFLVFSAFSRQR